MRIFRVVDDSASMWNIRYLTLWEYLKFRFMDKPYVENVKRAQKKGLIYEPLLYKDKCIYNKKNRITDCYNQELPRRK